MRYLLDHRYSCIIQLGLFTFSLHTPHRPIRVNRIELNQQSILKPGPHQQQCRSNGRTDGRAMTANTALWVE